MYIIYTGNIGIFLFIANTSEDSILFNSIFTGIKQSSITPKHNGCKEWLQSSSKRHADRMNHKKKRQRKQRRRRK